MFLEEYWTRRPIFNKKMFLKILIFKILYFLKMCPIFIGSCFIILVSLTPTLFSEKCLFPLDAYLVSCPTWSKNLWQYLVKLFPSVLDTVKLWTGAPWYPKDLQTPYERKILCLFTFWEKLTFAIVARWTIQDSTKILQAKRIYQNSKSFPWVST